MKSTQIRNPLIITGSVLLLNAFVFLLINVSLKMSVFLGMTLGCFGVGLALFITGLLKHKKGKTSIH